MAKIILVEDSWDGLAQVQSRVNRFLTHLARIFHAFMGVPERTNAVATNSPEDSIGAMGEPVQDHLPTRRSLLSRLRNWQDEESWGVFFDTYWRLIYGFAVKSGLSDAEAQDVVQETVISVAKRMKDFKYDPAVGSFKSWLLLITRRRIADFHRSRMRQPQPGGATDPDRPGNTVVAPMADPAGTDLDALWDQEWQRHLLATAIDRVRRLVEPKQFQIFDCYVLKEWSPKEVTRILGVSLGQVYLAKHRVSALVKKELARLEEGQVGNQLKEPR